MGDQNINERLFGAVWRNEPTTVLELLSETPGPNVNERHCLFEDEPTTALHVASQFGYSKIVAHLLDKGAERDLQDPSGCTPLHLASINRHLDVVKILLNNDRRGEQTIQQREEQKRYVDLRDGEGRTALHYAINSQDLQVIQCIVTEGADLSIPDCMGWTGVHYACSITGTDLTVVQWLFSKDRSAFNLPVVSVGQNQDQWTCLHIAANCNHGDLVSWLLDQMEQDDVKNKDARGMTAWDIASRSEYRFEAIAAFVLKDKKNGSMNHFFDWEKRFITGTFTVWSFYWNNRIGVITLVQYLDRKNRLDQEVARLTLEEFESVNALETILQKPLFTFNVAFDCLSIRIPFFHLQTLADVDNWRDPKKRDSSLQQLTKTWKYCCSQSAEAFDISIPLTLDEYCSSVLSRQTLDRLNRDQVLIKAKKAELLPVDQKNLPVTTELLMVSVFQIRKLGNEIIISSEHGIYDFTRGVRPVLTEDAKRHIGIILSRFIIKCLECTNRERSSSSKPVLDTFQKMITLVSEEVDEYMKDITVKDISIKKEQEFLHEISDIRAELSMIKRVLIQQEEIWREYAFHAWPEYWPAGQDGKMIMKPEELKKFGKNEIEEWQDVLRPQSYLLKCQQRIAQLDEDAERVENSILKKLDLKAKHATMRESHATAIMSAAVFGFTLITIIFTPLSFVMSLFALPIDRFKANQFDSPYENDTNRIYPSNYIGRYAATAEVVSIAVTLVAMWLAVEFGMRDLWGRLKKRLFGKQDEDETEASRPSRGSKGANPLSKGVVDEGARPSGGGTEQLRGDGNGDAKKHASIFRRIVPHRKSSPQDSEC